MTGNADNIVFTNNYLYDIQGPLPRGQIAQFAYATGAGNKVMCNISDNANSNMEDHISFFTSGGVAGSPAEVAYNRLSGGHSQNGSGITVGDWGAGTSISMTIPW